VIVLLLPELRDQLAEVISGVREKLVKSVFLALRIVASHQSHRLAEAPGHRHQANAQPAAEQIPLTRNEIAPLPGGALIRLLATPRTGCTGHAGDAASQHRARTCYYQRQTSPDRAT
jgi:hypothetical protein